MKYTNLNDAVVENGVFFSEYQSPLRYSIYQCTPSSNNCYQCIADRVIMWCRWLSCRTSTTRVSSTLSRCSRPRSGSSSSWRSYEVFLPQGSVSLSTLRFSTLHYDPAAHQDHCVWYRIRTRDLCQLCCATNMNTLASVVFTRWDGSQDPAFIMLRWKEIAISAPDWFFFLNIFWGHCPLFRTTINFDSVHYIRYVAHFIRCSVFVAAAAAPLIGGCIKCCSCCTAAAQLLMLFCCCRCRCCCYWSWPGQ